MTPEEVATFWYQKSLELETKLKYWFKRSSDLEDKLAQLSDEIVELTPKMTYEQIIDLKCENARLREENAKYAKWMRILDKIKIF